jgi:cyclase
MLRPRIIPCLLIHNKGLVKTVNFKNPKYVGDPINAVRIFNEKEVDEIIVLDIDATVKNKEPDYNLIKNLAAECRMPLCYGGGIKNVDQAKKLISLGAEKVAISSAAIENPSLIKNISNAVGSQSVVIVLDIKKTGIFKKYEIFTHNGKYKTGKSPRDFVKLMEKNGAGEIVINSIDKDGTMNGFDIELASEIRNSIDLPMTILGGAGSIKHIADIIKVFGIIGIAVGSLFVFKGVYKAVLINYPNYDEKQKIISGFL